jgi:predicted metalloendopeptidase
METIADDLATAYTQRISRLSWMHNDTKALVQEKIADTIPQIGYSKHVCPPLLSHSINNQA